MVISGHRISCASRVLAVITALVCAGCTSGAAGAPSDAWQVVTPPGIAPSSMTVAGDVMLVGGASADDRPALGQLEQGAWQDIPATAATAYGSKATLIHLAADPTGRVVAMGTATGGAHLNPRWTTWIGTTTGITEEPQTMETFGGPEAGGITDVISGDNPLVVGSWTFSAGVVGAAAWGHDGAIWVRRPGPPALSGTSAALTAATAADAETAADAADNSAVIAGFVTTFVGGSVHQQGVVWVSGPDRRTWTKDDLGTSDENSAATDISCSDDSCITVGRVGDRLAAWRLDGTAVTRIDGLPDRVVDRFVAAPRVSLRGPWVVIAGTGQDEVITTTVGDQWSSTAAPPGEVRKVALADNRIYLLLRSADGTETVVVRAR